MIPISDLNPTRRFALVCAGLIGINLLVFLCDILNPVTAQFYMARHGALVAAQETVGSLSYHFSLIPAYVTGRINAGSPPPVFPYPAFDPRVTIFTSMFLHANWLHILGNMLYLWIFGNNIEDVLGRWRFLLFYFVCGVCAAGLQIVIDPGSPVPTVGASGAIAGVMGAYVVLYPSVRVRTFIPIFGIFGFLTEIRALFVIGFWFLLQLANSQLLGGGEMMRPGGGVAYAAHVGGFLAGALGIVLLGGKGLTPEVAADERDSRPTYPENDRQDRR